MFRYVIWVLGIGILCLAIAVVGYRVWNAPQVAETSATAPAQAYTESDSPVRVSRQARENLGLVSQPLAATTYWRSIELPGIITERPGLSDRGVVSPVAGVVTDIYHFPGDMVEPGKPLFSIRLVSESLHKSQMELFKATQELEIARSHLVRLAEVAESGALPKSRIIDIENEIRRLNVSVAASRQELQMRGLSTDVIAAAASGEFVTDIVVRAPQLPHSVLNGHGEDDDHANDSADGHVSANDAVHAFEVHSLQVELGQQVDSGQLLTQLADHCALFIEGRAFKNDIPLIHAAAKEGWDVEVDFGSQSKGDWPGPDKLRIHNVANSVDAESNTFALYLLLENQFQEFQAPDGTQRRLWQFRPGGRVRLRVPVEKLDGVFVLPREAVIHEGPETYVFRQNGDLFDRRSVRLLHEDRLNAVVANDGSVRAGFYIAQSGAASLNRILKAQRSTGTPANFHVHADGTVHEAH